MIYKELVYYLVATDTIFTSTADIQTYKRNGFMGKKYLAVYNCLPILIGEL